MLKRTISTLHCKFAKSTPSIKDQFKIKSWQVHSYGDISEVQLYEARIPVIKNPQEVLVQVNAASVNPIDGYMLSGYGKTIFQIPRNFELELPLTLGRDFSGVVIGKGHEVGDNLKIGDEVYGFIPIHKQGSFAEIVLAEKCHVLPKPKHLTAEESTSLVYASMTAWSALFIFGNLQFRKTDGLRVLVLGASGGVGLAAVQMLKSQNCLVYGTCSGDAVEMVQKFGADYVYDYNDPNFEKNVEAEGRYHVILDAAKIGFENIPKNWMYETYITLNSPLLSNADKYGLVGGLAYSANMLLDANFSRFRKGSTVRWAFFVPSGRGFQFIDDLVRKEKLKPIVYKTFGFSEVPNAIKTVTEGHLRGKVVVNFNKQ